MTSRGKFLHLIVRQVQERRFSLECNPHLLLDPCQTAGHMSLGMAKHIPDSIEWPTSILAQSQHSQIPPLALVRMRKVIMHQLPELIRTGTRQNDFCSVYDVQPTCSSPI